MRIRSLLVAVVLAALPCCAGPQRSTAPQAEPGEAPAAASSGSAEATALRLVYSGTWRSPACGLRNHDQLLDLAGDGSFHLEDRISPCPQQSSCIWSGVESMDGRWQLDGDAIDLEPSKDAPAIARPPTRLHWRTPPAGVAAPAGMLEDQRGCLFVRQVPEPPETQPAGSTAKPSEARPAEPTAQPSVTQPSEPAAEPSDAQPAEPAAVPSETAPPATAQPSQATPPPASDPAREPAPGAPQQPPPPAP